MYSSREVCVPFLVARSRPQRCSTQHHRRAAGGGAQRKADQAHLFRPYIKRALVPRTEDNRKGRTRHSAPGVQCESACLASLKAPHSTTASGTGTAPITEFLASPLPLSEKSRVDHVYSKCHSKCAIPLGARAAGRRVCEETQTRADRASRHHMRWSPRADPHTCHECRERDGEPPRRASSTRALSKNAHGHATYHTFIKTRRVRSTSVLVATCKYLCKGATIESKLSRGTTRRAPRRAAAGGGAE